MDGSHFRNRAAEARRLSALGQDPELSHLLLEVAQELDSEAALIEAGVSRDRRASLRVPVSGVATLVWPSGEAPRGRLVTIADISLSGARLLGNAGVPVGQSIILELSGCRARLSGRVVRVEGREVGIAFSSDADTRQAVSRVYRFFLTRPRSDDEQAMGRA
jgi:hypothetical protein